MRLVLVMWGYEMIRTRPIWSEEEREARKTAWRLNFGSQAKILEQPK